MGFRNARKSAKMTQKQAADVLGISRTTVAMWETGLSKPRADKLKEVANLYGCKVDDLLDKEEATG